MQDDLGVVDSARKKAQQVAASLLTKTTIPAVAAQAAFLEEISEDAWWQDASVDMLEDLRKRVRSLVRFLDRVARHVVYTDFEDSLREAKTVDLPVAATGIDTARFNAKIESCFAAYADNPSLKRLRNNEQLTAADIQELERILVDSGVAETGTIESVAEQAGGLGLFLRSILGLERSAVEREFAKFLNRSEFSVEQVRFVGLIVDELSHNGVVNPERLFESPYTDTALRGPQQLFGDQVFPEIIVKLTEIKQKAIPSSLA